MKLSDILTSAKVIRDAEFSRLGYIDTQCAHLLAYADSLKFLLEAKKNPNLSCLITTPELAKEAGFVDGLITIDTPRLLFYQIHEYFIKKEYYTLPFEPGIGEGCDIHPSAIISPKCCIGNNVKIGEQAIVREGVWIGSNVTIEPGVKLGMEGILYNKTSNGVCLIPHAGYVHIDDYATLMTNSVVVKSIHDSDVTEIGRGALIGLATIVGHEAKVKDNAVISNQCVLARRSVIGKNAFLGTQVMIKENVFIAENAQVMAGSIVIENVGEGQAVSGNFATNHKNRMLELLRRKNKARL